VTKILHDTFVLELGKDTFVRGDVRVKGDAGRKPVLIIAHGFKGFKDWGMFPYAARRFAEEGFAVVTFNFSHNGVRERDFDELEKFGRNTYSQEQKDLAAVLAAVLEDRLPEAERMDKEQVVLVGHSRGGGNSVLFAAEHSSISGVASWNGIANVNLFNNEFRETVMRDGVGYIINARTKQEMPIQAVFFEDIDRNKKCFDIAARAAELRTPILFIQGMNDAERLVEGFRRLRAAAPQHRFAEIQGTNHTFGTVHPFAGTTDALEQAMAMTIQFFKGIISNKGV